MYVCNVSDKKSISQEICKLDERDFVSDFNICNNAESIGKKTMCRCKSSLIINVDIIK